MANSLLSGGIGIPEGAFKLLGNREVERAIGFIVQNITNLEQVINIVQGGSSELAWIRFNAAGTKVAGNSTGNILTVSRTAEGKYQITASEAFATSGGFYQYGVLVTPASVSGNGGDGVSPFLAFNGYDTTDTDDDTTKGSPLFLSSQTNDLYVLGANTDDVWIHDTANFTSAATQVDAEGSLSSAGSFRHGVMSAEGDYLWLSAGDGVATVRAFNVNTQTLYNFSDNVEDMEVFFAASVSGTPYVLVRNVTDGQIQKYVPNFGAETIGSPTITWSGTDVDQAAGSFIAIQDSEGYVWWPRDGHMVRIDPINGGAIKTHNYPVAGTSWTVTCPLCYDRLRNRIIASGSDTSPVNGIFAYSGWTNDEHSGTWSQALTAISSSGATAIYHDVVGDVFFVSNYGASLVHRFYGATWQLIDTVSVDDQSPANPQVDVDSMNTNAIVYVTNSDGTAYGYVLGNLSSQIKVVRISYGGDPIEAFGAGAGAVSSVLVPLYEITSATQAYVYLFRSLSPPVYADGECTVQFVN